MARWTTLSLAIAAAFATLLLAACRKSETASKPADVDYYTCTMHPSVKKQRPTDKCPICSMDLVPVKKAGSSDVGINLEHAHDTGPMSNAMISTNSIVEEKPGEFSVPVQRQQLIGVTYATIEKRPFKRTVNAVGMVAYDKQRHWDYVTRVEGYVKTLSVFSRGEIVEKDASILSIYSPDLLTTQREFVDTLNLRDEARAKGSLAVLASTEQLAESARQRLRLWNITEAQIAELERTRTPSETITLRSPFKGVVQDLGVDQGRRVMIGDHLVDIADLSVVWVWAQFYQNELPLLKVDLPITITTSSYPGETFAGKLSVVDPFINNVTRTGRVRIDVNNSGLKLRPDMFVDVEVAIEMGEGVAVPFSAVLPTGKHNVVFVDKGEGKLEPRFVELGRKYGDFYEVKTGLKEADRVVASGNFLIDAEAKIHGALKSW